MGSSNYIDILHSNNLHSAILLFHWLPRLSQSWIRAFMTLLDKSLQQLFIIQTPLTNARLK